MCAYISLQVAVGVFLLSGVEGSYSEWGGGGGGGFGARGVAIVSLEEDIRSQRKLMFKINSPYQNT